MWFNSNCTKNSNFFFWQRWLVCRAKKKKKQYLAINSPHRSWGRGSPKMKDCWSFWTKISIGGINENCSFRLSFNTKLTASFLHLKFIHDIWQILTTPKYTSKLKVRWEKSLENSITKLEATSLFGLKWEEGRGPLKNDTLLVMIF